MGYYHKKPNDDILKEMSDRLELDILYNKLNQLEEYRDNLENTLIKTRREIEDIRYKIANNPHHRI